MNKLELIEEIKNVLGEEATKACAERALNAVMEAISNGLKTTGSVQLVGFGSFNVVERPARTGVNPKTKAKMSIPASKTIRFKVGSKLKDSVA